MITVAKIDRIQTKIKAAIAKIEKQEKVSITFGSQRYSSTEYGTRMTVRTTSESEKTKNLFTVENIRISKRYGFSGNIVGMNYDGGVITGFKTRNRKYPIIFDRAGKSFKTSAWSVKSRLDPKAITRYNTLKDIL